MTDAGQWRRRLQEQIGEDPTRFLDRNLLENDGARELAKARIDGIRFVEVVRAWIAAERKLANEQERDPRAKVIEWLEDREIELRDSEYGDVPIRELPDRKRKHPIKPDWVWVYEHPRTGEIERTTERKTSPALESSVPWSWDDEADDETVDVEATSAREQRPVVTDGGE